MNQVGSPAGRFSQGRAMTLARHTVGVSCRAAIKAVA
jgi:hypothetical protein